MEAEAEAQAKAEAEAQAKAEAEEQAKAEAEAQAKAEAEAQAAIAQAEAEHGVAYPVLPAADLGMSGMGSLVEQLMAMGFTYDKSAEAIRSTEGDMEAAVMMLLSAPEDELAPEPEPTGPVWNDEWDELLVELEEMGFEDS